MVALYATASLSPKNFPGARKYATSPGRSFGRRSVRYRYPLAPSHSRPPSPPPSASPSHRPRITAAAIAPASAAPPTTASRSPGHELLCTRHPSLDNEKSERISPPSHIFLEQSGSVHPGRQWQLPSILQSPWTHGEHRTEQSNPVHMTSHLHVPSARHVPWSKLHGKHCTNRGTLQSSPVHPGSHSQSPRRRSTACRPGPGSTRTSRRVDTCRAAEWVSRSASPLTRGGRPRFGSVTPARSSRRRDGSSRTFYRTRRRTIPPRTRTCRRTDTFRASRRTLRT
eukprot:31250-Pelagococcus_subviridis.AAC.8